jgi:hypothetical protein
MFLCSPQDPQISNALRSGIKFPQLNFYCCIYQSFERFPPNNKNMRKNTIKERRSNLFVLFILRNEVHVSKKNPVSSVILKTLGQLEYCHKSLSILFGYRVQMLLQKD